MNDNIKQKIKLLFQRYAADEISVEEEKELFSWIRKLDDDEINSYLQEILEAQKPEEVYDSQRWNYILKGIFASVAKDNFKRDFRSKRKILLWTKVAAAVLILFSFSFTAYWLLKQPTPALADISERYKNDIPPGTDKARLMLVDGTILLLDTLQIGNIAKQEHTDIVKLEEGKLLYNDSISTMGSQSINTQTTEPLNTLTTPRGGQYQLTLADGTTVWLNAASSITFPTVFAGKERRVTIQGECYFEVAKNEEIPFIVNIHNKAEVKVLGTHFNINAYKDEDAIKTTLLEGRVNVSSSPSLFVSRSLSPGEQASINKDGELSVAKVDIAEAVAWQKGLFSFSKADIKTIMRQLERWYDIEVIYKGKLTTDSFTGKIPRSANLSELLRILEISEVHFRIEGRTITVLP